MENLSKRPSKGILKTSNSIERQDSKLTRQNSHDKDIKWDEMNILQTLHPPDKDYGHMKIEEPKTPYSYYAEDEDAEANSDTEAPKEIDLDNLADLINKKSKSAFSFDDSMEKFDEWAEDMNDEDLSALTEEERERRKDFESKRKKHYNEYQMVKLARKLMKDEMDEEQEDEDEDGGDGDANAKAPGRASTSAAVGDIATSQEDDISKA